MDTPTKKRNRKPDLRKGDRHRPRKPVWLSEADYEALKAFASRQDRPVGDVVMQMIKAALAQEGIESAQVVPEPVQPTDNLP